MKKSVYLVIAIILLITGCNDKGTNPTNSKVLIPLTIGNRWVYNIYEVDSTGNLEKTMIDTRHIVLDTVFNGINYVMMIDSIYEIRSNFVTYNYDFCTNRTDGYYSRLNYNKICLFLKYPGTKGEYYLFDSSKIIIDDINYALAIDFNKYRCYRYSSERFGNTKEIEYVSPGIGEILYEFYRSDTLTYKFELVSYTIK